MRGVLSGKHITIHRGLHSKNGKSGQHKQTHFFSSINLLFLMGRLIEKRMKWESLAAPPVLRMKKKWNFFWMNNEGREEEQGGERSVVCWGVMAARWAEGRAAQQRRRATATNHSQSLSQEKQSIQSRGNESEDWIGVALACEWKSGAQPMNQWN